MRYRLATPSACLRHRLKSIKSGCLEGTNEQEIVDRRRVG